MTTNLDPTLANVLELVEDALDAKEANNTAKTTPIPSQVRTVVKVTTTPVEVTVKAVEIVVNTTTPVEIAV